MSEVYNPLPDTSPSVLRQLARIEREYKRRELADAIVHGLLAAAFAIFAGVLACTVVFSCPI